MMRKRHGTAISFIDAFGRSMGFPENTSSQSVSLTTKPFLLCRLRTSFPRLRECGRDSSSLELHTTMPLFSITSSLHNHYLCGEWASGTRTNWPRGTQNWQLGTIRDGDNV